MKRIFSLFSSRRGPSHHAPNRVIDVLGTLSFTEWLISTVAAGGMIIILPMLALLFDAREAWMP